MVCLSFFWYHISLMNWYFSKWPTLEVRNHAWLKDLFKAQDRLMGFNVIKNKKLINMVSTSTLWLILTNWHRSSFHVESEHIIHNYVKRLIKYSCLFQLNTHVRPAFLYSLHPNNISRWTKCKIRYENLVVFC